MALPAVSPARIDEALDRFDREERALPKWQNWEANKNFKFAIVKNGRMYPVKEIVAQATGVPTTEFSGGSEANRYMEKLGFKIEALRLPPEGEVQAALHDLLLVRAPSSVEPRGLPVLADYFELPERLRAKPMENSSENHWQNRVRHARRKLVDAGIIDRLNTANGVSSCVRTLPCGSRRHMVQGRPDRVEGPHALGRALGPPPGAERCRHLPEHAPGPTERYCSSPHRQYCLHWNVDRRWFRRHGFRRVSSERIGQACLAIASHCATSCEWIRH